jgi:hypothetical protein
LYIRKEKKKTQGGMIACTVKTFVYRGREKLEIRSLAIRRERERKNASSVIRIFRQAGRNGLPAMHAADEVDCADVADRASAARGIAPFV